MKKNYYSIINGGATAPLKRITGAGVLLIEFIDGKPENMILCSEYYKGKLIAADFGGKVDPGHDEYITVSKELREESRNLFNINLNIFKLCKNIKVGPHDKDWVYSSFILPIETHRYARHFRSNKTKIESYHNDPKTGAVLHYWRETHNLIRFRITDLFTMIASSIVVCLDIDGRKWEIRNRTIGILKKILGTINFEEMTPITLKLTTYVSTRPETKFLDQTIMYKLGD
jgi:hypothetical protein